MKGGKLKIDLSLFPAFEGQALGQTGVCRTLFFMEYGSLGVLDKQVLSLEHHISQSWQNFCQLVAQHFPTLPCKMLPRAYQPKITPLTQLGSVKVNGTFGKRVSTFFFAPAVNSFTLSPQSVQSS